MLKPIKGYEGYYSIDESGNIFSHHTYNNKQPGYKKTYLGKRGYVVVDLCVKQKRKNHKVHRLVAQTFIPNPENKQQVNHKDLNKLNNHVSNLEWATAKENTKHFFDNGIRNYNYKKAPKLTEDIALAVLLDNADTKTIAKKYNIGQSTVIHIKLGTRWNYLQGRKALVKEMSDARKTIK